MPSSIPIRACPSCGALFQSPKREAPPFFEAYHATEEHVQATRCRACARFLWVKDAPYVGDLPMSGAHPVFDVRMVEPGLTPDAVARALAPPGERPADLPAMPYIVASSVGRSSAQSVADICRAAGAWIRIEPSGGDPRWEQWRAAPAARTLTRQEATAALDAGEGTTAMRHNYLVRLAI